MRNCPKHVEFYSKNKFEKLVHLVGFIIRIYHDARSSECQIHRAKVTADECRHLIQQNMLKKCSFFHYIYFTATQLNKIFTG